MKVLTFTQFTDFSNFYDEIMTCKKSLKDCFVNYQYL